jgi:deoxyribose-phosphate aldolase
MDDIDRLVGIIADRVKARLNGVQRSLRVLSRDELRATPCTDDPSHECGECGMCATRRPESVRAITSEGACRVGAGVDTGKLDLDLARMIDHTLLKADATAADVKKLCDEARKFCFASVCVNSSQVSRASAYLENSGVMVCAVVGFPLGAMSPTAKAFEAREAVRAGAHEIDMVINIGALKSRDYGLVEDDIRKVVQASRPAKVKVILETGALTQEEKIIGITLSKIAGAHFVKTSTGFGPGGATVEDVALMRKLVGDEMGVKASGGVRTHEDAARMRAAGANRIGASASVSIVSGADGAGDAKGNKGKGPAAASKGY